MRWLLEHGTQRGEWHESEDAAPPGTPAEILAALRDPPEDPIARVVGSTLYLLVLDETEDGDLTYALRVAPIAEVLDELDPPDHVRAERAAQRATSLAAAEEQQRRLDALPSLASETDFGEWA